MRSMFLTFFLISAISICSYAETLDTPSYVVSITPCAEGIVSCDEVKYVGVSKKSGKSIKLTGSTIHTLGADGVTPSRFLWYLFKNKETSYFVGDDGILRITRGKKVLVEEKGIWKP